MIPKNLFFIWIGDTYYDYIDTTIKEFQKVNPDFHIYLVRETIEDIRNSKNQCVINTSNYIEQTLVLDKPNKYYDYIKLMTNDGSGKRSFVAYFSDILRHELIETYGGIYIDCDTWPVKPFDDKLLNCNHFNALVNNEREYFFFGAAKGINSYLTNYDINLLNSSMNDKLNYSLTPYLTYDWKKYQTMRQKQLNSQLRTGEFYYDSEYYIDHYRANFWLNDQMPNNHTSLDKKYNTDFYR